MKDINTWRDSLSTGCQTQYGKCLIFPKLMYRFNYVSLKIKAIFLCVDGDEIIVKFRWKSTGPGVGELSGGTE